MTPAERTRAIEARMTDMTARYLWTALRPFLSHSLSRRCRRCVLSEASVALDDSGLCALCERESDASCDSEAGAGSRPSGEDLQSLLEARGTGEHDALLLLSGGKDSAYMLHRIRTEFPDLRVLTVLVDNGFMSPVALRNADRIVREFGVPNVRWRLSDRVVQRAFGFALTHLDRQTGYSIVDLMDGCLTFDTAMKMARAQGIPTVLCGLGTVQMAQVFGRAPIELSPKEYKRPLEDQLGVSLDSVLDAADRDTWFEANADEAGPRFVLPFATWDPTEEEVLRTVTDLGLMPAGDSRPLMTNNALIPVIGMAEVARFGYCGWELEFARMIREGKAERTYWRNMFEMLEYSTRTGRFINGTVVETLSALGLHKASLGIGT